MKSCGADIETERFDAKRGKHARNVGFICASIFDLSSKTSTYFVDPQTFRDALLQYDRIYFHNAVFDWSVLDRAGMVIPRDRVFCTRIMAYLLDENEKTALEVVAPKYLNEKKIEIEMDEDLDPTLESTQMYVHQDARLAGLLGEKLEGMLKEQGLWKLYSEMDLPMMWALLDATNEGMVIDKKALERYSAKVKGEMDRLRSVLVLENGEPINLNSCKQVANLLYRNPDAIPKQDDGKPKTDKKTIMHTPEYLLKPTAKDLQRYRALHKHHNAFCTGILRAIEPDGRAHPLYNVTAAVNGRTSSGNKKAYPIGFNVQQIPARGEFVVIRDNFVPPVDHATVCADADQLELKVLAHLSRDPELLNAYRKGIDLHTLTASRIFGVKFEDVTKEQRMVGKTLNFAVVYGTSEAGLDYNFLIPEEDGERYLEEWYRFYAGVADLKSRMIGFLHKNDYVPDMFGRRRRFPDFYKYNFKHKQSAIRSAFSIVVAGSASGLMRQCILGARKKLPIRYRFALYVHDEFGFYVPLDSVPKSCREIKDALESSHKTLLLPLTFSVGWGMSWYKAKH